MRGEFPGTPKIDQEDVSTGAVRMYLAEVQVGTDTAFLSIYTAPPADSMNADPQVTLDRARNGGVPARRIVVDIPHDRQVSVALIVLSVVPAGQEHSAAVQRFLGSFALVPR